MLTGGRLTEWNRLLCLCNINLFSSQSCSEFSSQNWSETIAKRQQESDYDERVVARSKPVRNLVSRSCAGPSTTPSSTVSSSPGIFGSEEHEMRYETRTVRPSSNNQKESLIEHHQVTNSQERHQDIRSSKTPKSPMTRELSQTSENPTACIGRPVPTFEGWAAGTGLETERDCGTIYHTIDSDSEENLEKNTDSWIRGESRIHGVLISAVEHWHEDDSIFKIFKINVSALYVFLTLSKQFQWRKSWKSIPLELSWLSSDSLKIQKLLSEFLSAILSISPPLLLLQELSENKGRNLRTRGILLLPT